MVLRKEVVQWPFQPTCKVEYRETPFCLEYHLNENCLWYYIRKYSNIRWIFFAQLLSHVWLFVTPWTAARLLCPLLSRSLLKLMAFEWMMLYSHPFLCHLPLLLPSVFSSIGVFPNESALLINWPKYWSFSITPSNEYPRLISFRSDWFDILTVQGALKSLLQHHSSKASILQHSAFFMVQLSHSYVTTGKTIALTRRTFVSKVISLLFNMLSRFVVALLPRSKRLLISWL